MTKQFRDFNDAKKFVQSIGLKNGKEWLEYCTSGNKPDDIPQKPARTYKDKGWEGFGDWLGTGRVADQDKQYRPYKDAKKFVQSLGLKGVKEWKEYCKSGKKPSDISASPNQTYKNKGWIGSGNFLGTKRIANQNRVYRPYKDAKKFIQTLGLKGQKEWEQYCKSGNKPDDIPSHPDRTYKHIGVYAWGDWLGTGNIANSKREFRDFQSAKKFVQSLELKTVQEWKEYCKSGNRPDDIPSAPKGTYKEWNGWGDFLGTKRIANQDKVYRPHKEAREFVRSLKLKNVREWTKYCKSGNKPSDIPATPWITYLKDKRKKK